MKLLIKNKTDTTLVILPTSWSIPPFQESTTEISTEWWERYKEEIDLMARKGLIDYDLKEVETPFATETWTPTEDKVHRIRWNSTNETLEYRKDDGSWVEVGSGGGGGVSTLSALIIDADKNWQGYSINGMNNLDMSGNLHVQGDARLDNQVEAGSLIVQGTATFQQGIDVSMDAYFRNNVIMNPGTVINAETVNVNNDLHVLGSAATFEVQNQNVSGTMNIDWGSGNMHRVTLTGNVTSVVFNEPHTSYGANLTLIVQQDSAGGHSIAGWPSSVKWEYNTPPNLDTLANNISVLVFTWTGTEYLGSWSDLYQ